MILISQTLASLEQHGNLFGLFRLKANLQIACILAARGEIVTAFTMLKTRVLGQALEIGNEHT
jgi:hypothetical protein